MLQSGEIPIEQNFGREPCRESGLGGEKKGNRGI